MCSTGDVVAIGYVFNLVTISGGAQIQRDESNLDGGRETSTRLDSARGQLGRIWGHSKAVLELDNYKP